MAASVTDIEPTTEQFHAECDAFLQQRYERRWTVESTGFVWGQGSDEVVLYEDGRSPELVAEVASIRDWRADLFDNGLGWITGPTEFGGRGLSRSHQSVFDLAARSYVVPSNGLLTISIGMIAPTIMRHGDDRLRRRYVPALHRGDLIACQLFSEPGAGSDLASLATRAERYGDGWRLTGQKVWTSGAQFSDIGEIICRTGAGGTHGDLTAFLVDMRAPGVTVRPLVQMTGAAAFNEVFLDDVWVSDEQRLGAVGDGWPVALTTLANERTAIGGEGFGGSGLLRFERYVAMARAFGMERDPVVRQHLADSYASLRIAKYSRQRAAARRAGGAAPGPEGALDKISLGRNVERISDLLGRILGPQLVADGGEWGTYAWREVVLGVPGYHIAGGTDEILHNIIGERVLGLPKEQQVSGPNQARPISTEGR